MRILASLLICAGASAMFSIHLFWGPANGQYVDDTYKDRYFNITVFWGPANGQYVDDTYKDRYFKPIEFEKVHRGAVNVQNITGIFNISQCSIDLMICLEDAPNDLICSRTAPTSYLTFVDTICPLMREKCHDYITTFQGPYLEFQEGPCHQAGAAEDVEYGR